MTTISTIIRTTSIIFVCVLCFILFSGTAYSQGTSLDTDEDGIPDIQELSVYGTDPKNADTDGDGYSDGDEIKKGFSPLVNNKKLAEVDTDNDRLTDDLEIAFGTNTAKKDTDSDGYSDGLEVAQSFDPRNPNPIKLKKHIEVILTKQRLSYYLGTVRLGEMSVSSGKWDWPTPTGSFSIMNKSPKAWSKLAGLWMPYWMGFAGGKFGIHDLPVWPNGKKEGENHIGKPVSHGCIRVAPKNAKKLYDWTPIGTQLIIKK